MVNQIGQFNLTKMFIYLFNLWIVKWVYEDQNRCSMPDEESRENLRLLLLRTLNKNQILILSRIKNTKNESITKILNNISIFHKIPLSTLKLNAKILKKLNLATFGNNSHYQTAKLTYFGNFVFEIIGGEFYVKRK